MRRDVLLGVAAAAMYAALVAVSWRYTPSRVDVEVLLYVIGGALEVAAVLVTVADVREKRRAARRFTAPPPPPATVQDVKVLQSAAAQGLASHGQIAHIGQPLLVALDGRRLAIAAGLLLAGIGVGTFANILSATH